MVEVVLIIRKAEWNLIISGSGIHDFAGRSIQMIRILLKHSLILPWIWTQICVV